MYSIEQKLIKINKYTRPAMKMIGVRGIAIHWTANYGATALNHYNYFNNGAGNRYAGCHYFVDKTSIIQLVPDNEVCYHVNDGGKSHVAKFNGLKVGSYVGNANCALVGIELCVEKDGSIHSETIKRGQWLTKHLMDKHKISVNDVYRHYDITKKNCPAPMVKNSAQWTAFKAGLAPTPTTPAPTKTHIGVATAKTDMSLRDKPNVNGKLIKTLPKNSAWKISAIEPNGWLKLGSGYASNVDGKYFDVKLDWSAK